MSRLVIVERSFTARKQAERWFDSIRKRVWPYVWCIHDADKHRWNVRALVEQDQLPTVIRDTHSTACTIRPCQ